MSLIRTAIVGFGVSGRVFHAPLISSDDEFELTAIVTRDPTRANAAKAEYPDAAVLDDFTQVLATPDDFDLVVIGSPNSTHAPLALSALDAGLHVLVDKPIAVTAADARTMVERAQRLDRRLAVFQNRRWDGDIRAIADLVRSGRLGEVRQFESAFEWWSPEVADRWKDTTTPQDGGGVLYDLGPHLIDQVIQLFGEVVEAHAELDRRRTGAVSDDDAFISLLHQNGTRSRLWMSVIAPSTRARFRVVGARATATIRGLDPQEAQLIAGLRPGDPGYGLTPGRVIDVEGPDGTDTVAVGPGDYPTFYRRLAAALRNHAEPLPVDPADAIAVLEILEMLASS